MNASSVKINIKNISPISILIPQPQMIELSELEQDIEALNKELEYLSKKRDVLKKKAEENNTAQLINHPLVKDFQFLFDSFPQMFVNLSNKLTDLGSVHFKDNSKNDDQNKDNDIISPPKLGSRSCIEDSRTPHHKIFDDSISDLIDTDFLTSPSKRKYSLKAGTPNELFKKVQLENAYRLFGITYFPVVDPADLEVDRDNTNLNITRKMLGIRLEVFNEKTANFERPHYILLKKDMKSDRWKVFKHTIPVYVDLEEILHHCIHGLIVSYEDIYIFAKEVFIELTNVSSRKQKLKEMEEHGLIYDLKLDLEAAKVTFAIDKLRVHLLLRNDEVISTFIENQPHLDTKVMELLLIGPIHELEYKLRHWKTRSAI